METVWIVRNSGEHDEESFNGSQDAMNYAKQTSLRAMCCIHASGKRVIFYERGEIADAGRSKELQQYVIEILEHKNEKYAKDGRGKANRKRV